MSFNLPIFAATGVLIPKSDDSTGDSGSGGNWNGGDYSHEMWIARRMEELGLRGKYRLKAKYHAFANKHEYWISFDNPADLSGVYIAKLPTACKDIKEHPVHVLKGRGFLNTGIFRKRVRGFSVLTYGD
jgi:hypothetical protein